MVCRGALTTARCSKHVSPNNPAAGSPRCAHLPSSVNTLQRCFFLLTLLYITTLCSFCFGQPHVKLQTKQPVKLWPVLTGVLDPTTSPGFSGSPAICTLLKIYKILTLFYKFIQVKNTFSGFLLKAIYKCLGGFWSFSVW